ncbi:MAG: CPBP family intramembrane glutamic endopeptidase [Acidobacteriota bacterium]
MSDPLDVARNIFINDESELRSGWRVLAFFLVFILAASLLTGLAKAFAMLFPSLDSLLVEPSDSGHLSRPELSYLAGSNFGNLAAAVIASAVCARTLERRSLGSVGFRLHRGWRPDFGLGSLMGAASLAIAVGIAAATGAFSFGVHTRDGAQIARGFIIVFLFFLSSGATEELIFRGFPFQALVHNLGGGTAVAMTSVIFGLVHIWNPSATALSTINTILAGLWLGLAYLMTRSLWLATALHYSWNFAMAFIFGLPVSGLTTLNELAWLRGSIGTPLWVSGGSYGPEGGVAATVALILSTLAIWKSGLFTPSEEMISAIKHGKREPAFASITPEEQPPSDLQPSEGESNPSPS